MAIALDGSVAAFSNVATSLDVNLTTSLPGLIVVGVVTNGFLRSDPTASGLTFTKRGEHEVSGSAGAQFETVYYAVSAAPVTGLTITSAQAAPAFLNVHAWGISGLDAAIWDPDAGLPVTGQPDPLSIDTDNANDLIYGAFRAGTQVCTQGAGWTAIQINDYHVTEYKIVSATQTALSVSLGTGATTSNGVIADAVMQDATPIVNPDILFLRR